MSLAAYAVEARSPLLELLDAQFGDAALAALLERDTSLPWELWDVSLVAPLREFFSRPGRELRGEMVLAAWQLGGQRGAPPGPLPLVVELLHAGSLIVDDIEDGSAYRRGAPALHVRFGLPRALNAGNFCYFWAEALLGRLDVPPSTELELRRVVSRTLVAAHAGQGLDLGVRVHDVAQRDLPEVVAATTHFKTGRLVQLAAELGAVAAGATPERISQLATFGADLGVGLQMLDDLSGLTVTARARKGHEDLVGGRATWPWAWAAERAQPREYAALVALSREVARGISRPEELADRLGPLTAEHGRACIRAHLDGAVARLTRAVGAGPVLAQVVRAVERLERSFG